MKRALLGLTTLALSCSTPTVVNPSRPITIVR